MAGCFVNHGIAFEWNLTDTCMSACLEAGAMLSWESQSLSLHAMTILTSKGKRLAHRTVLCNPLQSSHHHTSALDRRGNACRSLPGFAGISASNPFGIGASKGSDAADKQRSGEEQKGKGDKGGKDGDAQAKSKALAEGQKEERHRKDDAAGRSNNKEQHSNSDRDKGQESRAKQQKEREAKERAAESQKGESEQKNTMQANVARGLVGIWREFNEEDDKKASGRSSDDDTKQASEASGKEGEGIVPDDSGPVARIVAYSDSDSDEPLPLPFQKQRDKASATASDAEADDASVSEPEGGKKRRWPWRSLAKRLPEEVPPVCNPLDSLAPRT